MWNPGTGHDQKGTEYKFIHKNIVQNGALGVQKSYKFTAPKKMQPFWQWLRQGFKQDTIMNK